MERLEMERVQKEKWQQLEAKDLDRKNEELQELYLLEGCFSEAEKLKRDNRLLSQWKHYIQCDGSPDPSISQEINTFISLWKEETNEIFEEVIAKSKLVLHLIDKLKLILLETSPYNLQDKNIAQYQGSILELQELLHLKFNTATELLLRQASTLADLDTGNMEKVIQDENITLYVWANLKKNPRYRSVRCTEIQIGFDIPRILATSDIALRLLHTHYDHVTPLRSVPKLFQVPTSTISHSVKDNIKNVQAAVGKEFQEEYKQLEDECDSVQEGEIKVEEQGDIEVQMSSVQEESGNTKYELEMKLLSETVSAGNHWKTDGISNVSYKSGERLVTFSLETFGPVTLIQDTHINMPYQSWELRPLDVNKVLLTVITVFTEIQIQIKEDLCMLASIKLNNKKHSSILEGKWMTPISFIIALKEAGLNIFPTGQSHFYVATNSKVPLVEMKAYRQMALLSPAFAFGWSRWNAQCDSKKIVFKVSEHLTEQQPFQNPNWTLLMFNGDRAQRLKIDEYSEAFSEALKEETEFHSTLYHMVKDFASKEAMEKIRSSSCQFIDSVCHMLLSIRLLSYS
ncbi:dynein axonemal intermediate chain 7 isoform X2 [Pteronotus mesoamericanus]|uniref:dynein axonemal intermediate chain 7 isoform X2 n=1 Tax=Pteronotus mesoamericanus TaxID=1884717 RepID=UPI0023ED37AC|nr:dynein axonemal intermediate chain 7 isoform X2 [Pteronotus parnellii mesoamericanus]